MLHAIYFAMIICMIFLQTGTARALTTDEIISLKKAGVSDEIIKAMIENEKKTEKDSKQAKREQYTHQINTIREALARLETRSNNIKEIYDDGFRWYYHLCVRYEHTPRGQCEASLEDTAYIKYSDVKKIEKRDGRPAFNFFMKRHFILFWFKNDAFSRFSSDDEYRQCGLIFPTAEERDTVFNAMMDLRKAGFNGNAPPSERRGSFSKN